MFALLLLSTITFIGFTGCRVYRFLHYHECKISQHSMQCFAPCAFQLCIVDARESRSSFFATLGSRACNKASSCNAVFPPRLEISSCKAGGEQGLQNARSSCPQTEKRRKTTRNDEKRRKTKKNNKKQRKTIKNNIKRRKN